MGHTQGSKLARHPSGGCRQHLSTSELIKRTQEERALRHQKKLGRSKVDDSSKEG